MKFERKALDQRPGAVPEIRVDGDSVIFYLDVPAEHARLIIRCNPDGTAGSSIDFGQGVDPQQ
jgi:hypothetical protein